MEKNENEDFSGGMERSDRKKIAVDGEEQKWIFGRRNGDELSNDLGGGKERSEVKILSEGWR